MKVNLVRRRPESAKPFEIRLISFPTTIGLSSEPHCEINLVNDWLVVRDLASKHGTFVNGVPIDVTPLLHGDKLSVGNASFVAHYDVSTKSQQHNGYSARDVAERELRHLPSFPAAPWQSIPHVKLLDLLEALGQQRGHLPAPDEATLSRLEAIFPDPLHAELFEHMLLRTLTEPEQWDAWSQNGIDGTREHYSWAKHADRYLRDLNDIIESANLVVKVNMPARRLPAFDRLIITDLDNTLTGDEKALQEFIQVINSHENVGFGIATGRRLDSALALIEELGLPQPDLIDTDVGTQLHYGSQLTADRSWRKSIGYAWKPDEIRRVLKDVPGLTLQGDASQSEYKISFRYDSKQKITSKQVKRLLREAGLRAKVVMSLGTFLDVIPVRGGSDLSMRHVLWKWGFVPEHVLVAGDSGNDAGMLLGRTLGVVVGNHSKELRRLKNRPRVYFAESSHAAGILEGIQYYSFLGDIEIPNDRLESERQT